MIHIQPHSLKLKDTQNFFVMIETSIFYAKLKYANIIPVHKKDETSKKSNYRHINVLPVVAKLIERILHKQISHYIDQYLSKFLCGYRKGYDPQQALIIMLEKWRTSLDNKGFSEAILMDLSKAFDIRTTYYETSCLWIYEKGSGSYSFLSYTEMAKN